MNLYLRVVDGSRALDIPKRARLLCIDVIPLGPDYSYTCQIKVRYQDRTISLYARHVNRLSEHTFHLHNGDPTKRITVRHE